MREEITVVAEEWLLRPGRLRRFPGLRQVLFRELPELEASRPFRAVLREVLPYLGEEWESVSECRDPSCPECVDLRRRSGKQRRRPS